MEDWREMKKLFFTIIFILTSLNAFAASTSVTNVASNVIVSTNAVAKWEILTNWFGNPSVAALTFGINPTQFLSLSANGGLSLGSSYISTDAGAGNLIVSGKVGIGTTSPNYLLEINGSLGVEGHIQTHGTAPTLTSCGGSPSIVGNDNSFTITVGTTATGCTATFATAWTNAPSCTVTNQSTSITNAMTYTVSTSAVVVSQAAGLSGDILNVVCQGYY